MKKNIKLCMLLSGLIVFGIELQGAAQPGTQLYDALNGTNYYQPRGNSGASSRRNDSVDPDISDQFDRTSSKKAENIISRAFADMDAWMKKSSNLKEIEATNYINKALQKLGKDIGNSSMKPVQDVAARAIEFFGTESVVTKKGTISNKVLAGIVNGIKIAMTAPVKLAIIGTGAVGGYAAGGVGGAVVGLGAGINRTAKAMYKSASIEGQISMKSVAASIPTQIMHALKGVVNTAALTAYGALEGVKRGEYVGIGVTNELVGGKVFGLKENKAAQQKEWERAMEQTKEKYARQFNRSGQQPAAQQQHEQQGRSAQSTKAVNPVL